ncbi:PQQ-binding-like beta-propeller repeat protein [Nonomuraea sp. CA-141351]|uniref:outer membrane protein assembly factor BamB family protein n=1 Tax=Nonomuraea sp. CA-141351 TaxID=3239996 RepID=UPI003D932BFF
MRKGWLGAGVALAGTGAAGWGYFLRRPLPVELPILINLGLLLALGLLIWLVIDLIRLARATARAEGDDTGLAEAQVTVRVRAIAVAFVAVPLALYGIGRVRQTFAGGLPEYGEILFGTGLVAATAGIVLMAAVVPDFRVKPFAGMGTGLAATAAVLAAMSLAGATLPVEAVTAGESVLPEAAVAGTVSRLAWRWNVPDGTPARQVAVAGGNALVRTGDGVVALDTRTGRERWHYRRPAAAATGFEVAPDGSVMVLTFGQEMGEEQTRGRTVVLDARTGEVRAEHAGRPFADTDPASHGLVGISRDGTMIGRDPADPAKHVWERPVRKGCHIDRRLVKPYAVLRDVVAVVSDCGEETEVTGLDPADGAEVWRHESERSGYVEIIPSHDLSAVRLRIADETDLVLDQKTGKAVKAVTGSEATLDRFVADGHVLPRAENRSEPYATGGARTAPRPDQGDHPDWGSGFVPLKDGVLVAEVTATGQTSMTVTAHVMPWNAAGGTDIPFGMDVNGNTRENRFTLLPAAGAVVVALSASATIVGLT